MFKTVIKIAVVLLLLKELWLLLQIPSVTDAVFSFVMVGELPGTDTTLTPNQMLWLLAAVFVAASSLIFRKELTSLFRALFRRQTKTLLEPAEQSTPVGPPVNAPITSAPPKQRRERVAPAWLLTVRRGIKLRTGQANMLARTYAVKAWGAAVLAARYAWKITLLAYILITALAIEAWHWLRPRIERFDRWLDKRLHQNEHTAAILAVGHDMQRAVSKWWADFKAIDDTDSSQK